MARHAGQGVAPPRAPCAAGLGVPPPPGLACRARCGIATNRLRRGATAAMRSVPLSSRSALPPCVDTCHPCTRARHAAFFQATGRPTSPTGNVAASSIHVAPPPCEACAAGLGVPPPPSVACQRGPAAGCGIAANWLRRDATAAVRTAAAVRRGVPSMHPGTSERRAAGDARRRRHRCRSVPPQAHSFPLNFKQLVGRPVPVSRLA